MDGDGGLNMHNWGYYESSSFKSHVNLQFTTNMADRKPLLGGRDSVTMENVNGGFNQRDFGVPSLHYNMGYMRDAWFHRDNKFFNMVPNNPNYTVLPETTATHHHLVQMRTRPESSTEDRVADDDGTVGECNNGPSKNRKASKAETAAKIKKSKRASNAIKDGNRSSVHRAKSTKKTEVVINGIEMDMSTIPIPVCSCTGTPQQCYRWGSGGWQSACCTTGMSMYPLPMSMKRRGGRIAGRKMSIGAFKKVLEKLDAEGYNFANPIDLRIYWAKHGTNKFVTIR